MAAGFVKWSFRSDATASNPESRDSGSGANAPSRNDTGVSQKALRIDIHLELEIAFGLGATSQPLAQIFGQVEIAPRLRQQAKPVATLDDRERRLCRSE